jgi:hypothetical protein
VVSIELSEMPILAAAVELKGEMITPPHLLYIPPPPTPALQVGCHPKQVPVFKLSLFS